MIAADISTAPQVAALQEELVATRRDLHRHPELGFQETRTAGLIAARLRSIPGVEAVREGVGVTGVTALIRGAHPGPTILLRADIDALPIHEATGAPYASTRAGVMHACGHDGHTAILLAVARVLTGHRDRLRGNVFLVFQPAEEILTGAQAMLDAGVLDLAEAPVVATLGLHLANWLPVGTVGVREGPSFAAVDRIEIRIIGRGGHGAQPQLTVDPVLAAAEAVVSLQRVVSREISPLEPVVLSICQIEGGTAFNIIPEEVRLVGTVRTFDDAVRRSVAERIDRILAGVAAAAGGHHELRVESGPPAVVNDPAVCALVRAMALPVVGAERVIVSERTMGGDDVALFLNRAPGCYFLVGTRDPSRGFDAPHHHPRFDIAEEALATAATILADSALQYLA